MSHTYKYPRPALSVDCVVFGLDNESLKMLLIQRDQPPFEGGWALPGGFMEIDETLDQAARRELCEETGIDLPRGLEQLHCFSAVDRDPRGRVITVGYYALVRLSDYCPRAASDARRAAWFPVRRPPKLAFDHRQILALALERLRNKVRRHPVGFELFPEGFTLRQLQHLYEVILGRPLDKRNFRRKVLRMDVLVACEMERGVAHRAARIYRFDKARYRRRSKQGLDFEI